MNVKTFFAELRKNTSSEEIISSASFFFEPDKEQYLTNFDNYVERIKNISTFSRACQLFNISENETSLIKIFNSRKTQENFIFFNPKYLSDLMTEEYEEPSDTKIILTIDEPSSNTQQIKDYILKYKNLFNSYAVSKSKKFKIKKTKKISSDFFFTTTEEQFQMKIYLTNERIYAGGRLSLPNSISFKLVDSTIIYQSKIVFSKKSLETIESFQKYISYYKTIFFNSSNLIYINLSEPTFTFSLSIEKPIDGYVSLHSKKTFRIKKEEEQYFVVFKNIESFEKLNILKYLLASEIEHYRLWVEMVKDIDILELKKPILDNVCRYYL